MKTAIVFFVYRYQLGWIEVVGCFVQMPDGVAANWWGG